MAAGRSEQPLADHRRLAGAVVVENQADVQLRGNRLLDDPDELTEFDGPVARVARADDFAVGETEGGKERRGAVAPVVVGLPRGCPRTQREHRLDAVLRLDLRLIVHAEDDRRLWRPHVEPDDVTHLLEGGRSRA